MHPETGCQTVYSHFCSIVGPKIQEIVRRLLTFGRQFLRRLSLASSVHGLTTLFEAALPMQQANASFPAKQRRERHFVCRMQATHFISALSLPAHIPKESNRSGLSGITVCRIAEQCRHSVQWPNLGKGKQINPIFSSMVNRNYRQLFTSPCCGARIVSIPS